MNLPASCCVLDSLLLHVKSMLNQVTDLEPGLRSLQLQAPTLDSFSREVFHDKRVRQHLSALGGFKASRTLRSWHARGRQRA